ncbi:UNVERIFIED_CONTAM: hypothetical protein GTU68_002865 [Idotea baltica]|nr:hypothetical protein [Idotea baltica]
MPEYAFIGRSNVGKSSLINMLTDQKKLAKTSGTPGKTQTINYFTINEEWYLVDLPGYGYARSSKVQRKKWERFIRDYLSRRMNLMCVCLLIDARIKPQQNDLEFANWMGELQIPFVIVFTKAEKSKPEELEANITAFKNAFLESWEEFPQHFITSATSGMGKDDVLGFIDSVNPSFVPL